jgi:hypothetical protein
MSHDTPDIPDSVKKAVEAQGRLIAERLRREAGFSFNNTPAQITWLASLITGELVAGLVIGVRVSYAPRQAARYSAGEVGAVAEPPTLGYRRVRRRPTKRESLMRPILRSRTRFAVLLSAAAAAAIAVGVIASTGAAQGPPTTLHLVATAQKNIGFAPDHDPPPRQGDQFGGGSKITGGRNGHPALRVYRHRQESPLQHPAESVPGQTERPGARPESDRPHPDPAHRRNRRLQRCPRHNPGDADHPDEGPVHGGALAGTLREPFPAHRASSRAALSPGCDRSRRFCAARWRSDRRAAS